MGEIFDGKRPAEAMRVKLMNKVSKLGVGESPTLAIVRIGEEPGDMAYERGAIASAESVGIQVLRKSLGRDISEEELIAVVKSLNADDSIDGVLMLKPFPKHINDRRVSDSLAVEKDIDGISSASMVGTYIGAGAGFEPCTARACMEMLRYYGVELRGKNVVIVGRSLVIGRPFAMMAMGEDATVTICHSKTKNMAEICRNADVVIAAMGAANYLGREYFDGSQIVLDVGINQDGDGNLCGDVDMKNVVDLTKGITPVPGGVGTVTTMVMLMNVVDSRMKKRGLI